MTPRESALAGDKICAGLTVVPTTLAFAKSFVGLHHRHNKAPVGHKFSIAVADVTGTVRGVVICGRPVARGLSDGFTLEVSRSCTNAGARHVNSMLYGAARAAAKALGYRRIITYTQANESGASLRAVGWVRTAELPARKAWAESTQGKMKAKRDPIGTGDVARVRWEIHFGGQP